MGFDSGNRGEGVGQYSDLQWGKTSGPTEPVVKGVASPRSKLGSGETYEEEIGQMPERVGTSSQ